MTSNDRRFLEFVICLGIIFEKSYDEILRDFENLKRLADFKPVEKGHSTSQKEMTVKVNAFRVFEEKRKQMISIDHLLILFYIGRSTYYLISNLIFVSELKKTGQVKFFSFAVFGVKYSSH